MNTASTLVRLAVRTVVELVLRCGDIDSRFVESSVMRDGSKAHRNIQKSMGSNYQKEVFLRREMEIGGIPLLIQGRADGVITEEDGSFTIDEIKTTTLPLDRLYEQHELHRGQAMCYAFMLMEKLETPTEHAGVQLTYCQLETNEIQRHHWTYSRQELREFFCGLMERYGHWLRYERDWRETRNASAKAMEFPFPAYRMGQRELAVAVYRTIGRQSRLYAQAPTGIGKTLSSLFPSIKAMGEENPGAGKLFYLTAKTVTRTVAEEAVRIMTGRGLRFKSVTLRAKDKICFQSETICTPDHCPYARGHYDRINGALKDILAQHDLITTPIVEEFAEKHRVCPHEYTLDIALWADMVICDYNHVFDPAVYLRRFFGEETGDYVFLIDEAHNLGDRVRDMYSASLKKTSFYRMKRKLTDKNKPAAKARKAMNAINKYLLDERKKCEEHRSRVETEPDRVFGALAELFMKAAEEWLAMERRSGHPLQEDMLELYFSTGAFLGILELYNERYVTITETDGREVEVTLFCLDPSEAVRKGLDKAKAAILFSATLTPLPYYRELLGGGEGDRMLALPSPFRQENLLLLAHQGISTKYTDRPNSYEPIAEAVHEVISARRGNYLIYFSSYDYMRRVHEIFAQRYPTIETLVQHGSMPEDERERFLASFAADNQETLAGFCVLGGVFSEGIDLKGERLIGSVVVGVGLPGISLRQDLIREYFDERKGSGAGYDYAYVYPGMNKVLQAAGRVIRSETDQGVVLLIDARFGTAKYRNLYPAFWSHMLTVRDMDGLRDCLQEFQ